MQKALGNYFLMPTEEAHEDRITEATSTARYSGFDQEKGW